MSLSSGNRQIIVISGSQSDCLTHAKKLTTNLDCLLLEEQKKVQSFLGQEFDAVIFDCHAKDTEKHHVKVGGCAFDPNAFGAITGTICGGGYLLLLTPENPSDKSLFLQRFWSVLSMYDHLQITALSSNDTPLISPQTSLQKNNHGSVDQDDAVDKIIHVVKGHRRRPLVITSDRGRGKSAALGIAAAKLFEVGYKNIIVCAPSKKTAAIIFKHALKDSPDCVLTFYSPDELQQQKPKADLVLIDEAAAIPVSLLSSFLTYYSRIVFATTQHGYEGSGRGFAINFKKVLDNIAPEWVSCELNTPIRWSENDTLENFVFDALLLNAEPAELNDTSLSGTKNIMQKWGGVHSTSSAELLSINSIIDKNAVIDDSAMLSELFGLLVSAHYQTKPSDLMHLLDDDLISIHVIQINKQIVAVALLIKEGGIDVKTATDIFEGSRRLKGHLVAQSLAANAGVENAPCMHGERIIRIAVHPELQQQGLGTALLKSLMQNSKADYLSTSFGATTELLSFWQQLKFTPVYLGMKRDASSGTHSVVMLHSKTTVGETLLETAAQRFEKHFPHLLLEPFRELETKLVLALLTPQESLQIDEEKELIAFANKQRGYENTVYPIWRFVYNRLSTTFKRSKENLNDDEKEILVLKVLQKHSWKDVAKKMGGDIHGKKDALLLLRRAISNIMD
ncbi:MAG: GNAT family N-acetyltransferase [Cocleimonas sp.]|nr:GNAT family N-acetyltransferase [Cocleimonas sp.]